MGEDKSQKRCSTSTLIALAMGLPFYSFRLTVSKGDVSAVFHLQETSQTDCLINTNPSTLKPCYYYFVILS